MKNNIESIRKLKKISQQELADVLEVTRQTISSLENGRYNPSISLAFKIARFFNMSIEEIFIYEGDWFFMKKTKMVLTARALILLALMLFLFAIITQNALSNIYVTGALYLSAIISFSIGAILAFIAALKDKEHMKNVELSKKDERLQNITMRSKAKAFDIVMYLLQLTTAYLYLSKVVSTDALIILGVLILALLIIQLYYFCKYSKEM